MFLSGRSSRVKIILTTSENRAINLPFEFVRLNLPRKYRPSFGEWKPMVWDRFFENFKSNEFGTGANKI